MLYLFNPGKAPIMYGRLVFPAGAYSVVSEEDAANIRQTSIDVRIEGDENFVPIWLHFNGETQ